MEFENLKYEQTNNVGIVRINRPEVKNALHFNLLEHIGDMFNQLKTNDEIDIILLTGYKDETNSFFSSGIDLNDLKSLNEENHSEKDLNENIANLQNALHAIEDVGKVVIAQVTGFCFGSGLEVALACDFILSSPETKFGLLETRFGIIPDLGGTFRLVRRVGYQRTKQIIMLAETFDAQEAYRIGLIDWISPLNEIDKFIKKIITQINQNDFRAVLTAKTLIDKIHPINRIESSKYERETQIKLISKNPTV